jgi:glutathione S-transferase
VDDGTVLPFHQIPCLVADGVSISQTGGIARLCGKLAGLYPVDDHLKAGIIDQFLDFATDITVMISITMKEKDDSKRIALRQKLVSGPLTKKLTMLERCIPDNSDWIVAPNLTIADIAIWRVLGWLSSGMIEGLPTHMFSNFPKIQRVCLAVDRQPKVQEWILKTYPANYVRGNY